MSNNKRKYSVHKVSADVYVTSHSMYWFELIINWGNRRRRAHFTPSDRTLEMQKGSIRKKQWSMVNKYPKYLYQDILLGVYEQLISGCMYHEMNQDGEYRYDDFRYHCSEMRHHQLDMVTSQLTRDNYPRMVEIFNANTSIGDQFWTTSADGNVVVITHPARIDESGDAKVSVKRLDDIGGRDRWALVFLSPLYKNQAV